MEIPLSEWFSGVALGLVLVALGVWLVGRALDVEAAARRAGRDDARRAGLRRRAEDAYWEGYNQEMYGDPEGPTIRAQYRITPKEK